MLYAGRFETVNVSFAMFASGFTDFIVLLSTTDGAFSPYIASFLTGGLQFLDHDIIVLAELIGTTQQALAIVEDVLLGEG